MPFCLGLHSPDGACWGKNRVFVPWLLVETIFLYHPNTMRLASRYVHKNCNALWCLTEPT